MKSEKEVNDWVFEFDENTNKYPGMTYEQGVYYALQWVLDEIDDPMEE